MFRPGWADGGMAEDIIFALFSCDASQVRVTAAMWIAGQSRWFPPGQLAGLLRARGHLDGRGAVTGSEVKSVTEAGRTADVADDRAGDDRVHPEQPRPRLPPVGQEESIGGPQCKGSDGLMCSHDGELGAGRWVIRFLV
jgi:hypothetical protein